MLSNFGLNHLLTFPIKEADARKPFLIGALVYLAAFIIPIIPMLFVTGYIMRIMHQVLKGERPHMVEWDEWEEMLTDFRCSSVDFSSFLYCSWLFKYHIACSRSSRNRQG